MSNLEMEISDSEEEEDEEMAFLVFPALYLLSKKNRTPLNTSVLTGPMYIRELLDGHPTRCFDFLRMESHIFQALYDYLRSRKLFKNSRGVSVKEQLGMLMYMLSRNANYRTLTDRFQRSPETLHRHINACINAITSLAYGFIKLPSTDPHFKISSSPLYWPYFEVHSICEV
jgi:hypothetical protein